MDRTYFPSQIGLEIAKVRGLYREGHSISAISNAMKIPEYVVRLHLDDYAREVIYLQEEGYSLDEIANKKYVTVDFIEHLIREYPF